MFTFLKGLSKAQKGTLAVCFFAFLLNGTMTLMMGSALPDIKISYGLSDTQSGMMLSALSIGNLIAGFFSGLVPFWIGQKRSIVTLSAFTFAGVLGITLIGAHIWLLLCFVFLGIGRGSVANFNNAMVNRVSGGSPAASNLLHSFFAVGAFTAPLLFLVMSGGGNWRIPLWYTSLLAATSVFLFSRLGLPNTRPGKQDKSHSSMAFLKNPSYLILALMMFFYLCAEFSVNGWLVTFLQHKPSLASAFENNLVLKVYSQTMATTLWVVILIGRLTCVFLSQRIPQKKLMLFFSIGIAVFFAVLLWQNTIFLVTLSIIGLGFCMAGISPMIYSDVSTFTNVYPMAISGIMAIGSSGAILMPIIVGATAESFGFSGGMATIMIAIILLVVFAFLNVSVKTRHPKNA